MYYLDFERFTKEGKNLISLMEKFNEDGLFDKHINYLSNKLNSIETDTDNFNCDDYGYLYYEITKNTELLDFKQTFDILISISILYCASLIYQYGVITYPNCRSMEYFEQSDLQKLADIIGYQITYNTDEFIVCDSHLEDCMCAIPS